MENYLGFPTGLPRMFSYAAVLLLASCDQASYLVDGNHQGTSTSFQVSPPQTLRQPLSYRQALELPTEELLARYHHQMGGHGGKAMPPPPPAGARLETARIARALAFRGAGRSWPNRARQHYRQWQESQGDPGLSPTDRESWERFCNGVLERAAFESDDMNAASEAVSIVRQQARILLGDTPCSRKAKWFVAVLTRDPSGNRAGERVHHAPAVEETAPQITAVSVDSIGPTTIRAVVSLDAVPDLQVDELRNDSIVRVELHLSGANVDVEVPRQTRVAREGLERIFVRDTKDGATVGFEVDPAASHRTFFLTDPFRLTFDVSHEPHRAAADQGRVRVVVLDPGHGGDDFGARNQELTESSLTLDLAMRAATLLEEQLPSVRVLLTRRRDRMVPLEERVAFANRVSADVFVSIHLNGWEGQLTRGGVSTFVLDTTDDRAAVELAARENGTSKAAVSSMQRLLAGLVRGEQDPESRKLAERVHRAVLDKGRERLPGLSDRGIKSAMFFVLVGTRMPAILLEASFLTQDAEGEALRTATYRQALAEGIAGGIVAYARQRSGIAGR